MRGGIRASVNRVLGPPRESAATVLPNRRADGDVTRFQLAVRRGVALAEHPTEFLDEA